MDSAEQESKLVLLVSCELSSTVGSSGSRNDEALIDVDCEVSTLTHNNFSNSRRVKSKQTAQKGATLNKDGDNGKQPCQGIPACFPHKGKPTGKVAMHMVIAGQDEDYTPSEGESSMGGNAQNANLQQALKAGK